MVEPDDEELKRIVYILGGMSDINDRLAAIEAKQDQILGALDGIAKLMVASDEDVERLYNAFNRAGHG